MTDRKPSDTSSEEDFAAMFAASERETGHARRPRFAIGDRVRGKIVSIGQEVTVLELAGGGEGTLETLELRDEDGQLTVKEGDTLEARVIAHGEKQGFVTLRRGPGQGGRTNLAEAVATGLPVEGVITGVNKGGLEVDVGGVRAFCPLSQLELRPVDDPADYVGRRLSFRVTRHEEDRRGTNVVLSRRALLEEEARGRAAETRGKVVVGAVLPGVVTALKDFGAFVDVGGIEGLLPASEIGFDRGMRPADVLTVGQPVTVQVMRVEKRDDPKRPEQVSFSLKALERDPWQDAAAQLPRRHQRARSGNAHGIVRRVRAAHARRRRPHSHQRARRAAPAAPRARRRQAGRPPRRHRAGARAGQAPHLARPRRPRGHRRRRGPRRGRARLGRRRQGRHGNPGGPPQGQAAGSLNH